MAKKIDYASMFTLRSDGRYQGYWHDLNADGQPKGARHTICDRDPERLYHRIHEKEQPTELTFRAIAEAWYSKKWEDYSAGTHDAYQAPYDRAVEEFGDRAATSILTPEIKAMLERLNDRGMSARTIKEQRTVIKLIYQNAINDREMGQQVRENPAAAAALPANMKRPKTREAPEDAIVAAIRDRAGTAYWGIYCLFLISTGFRRGEALATKWEDVDFDAKVIRCNKLISYRKTQIIGKPKTENGFREVPLLPDLAGPLAAYKPANAQGSDYVFFGTDPSKPLSRSTFLDRWMHYCKDMGFAVDEPVEKIGKNGHKYVKHHWRTTLTSHNMRHGYATMLFDAEVDEFTAQKLLGHANIETTRAVYTHLRQRKQQSSIKKLEAYVKKEIGKDFAE